MYLSAYAGPKAALSMLCVFRFCFCRSQKRRWPAVLAPGESSGLHTPYWGLQPSTELGRAAGSGLPGGCIRQEGCHEPASVG